MSTLHFTRTIHALLPRYASDFRCIGSECEDTCCAGWNVNIDKKTLRIFQQGKLPGLKSHFEQVAKLAASSKNRHGDLELKLNDRACPFLEERLCAMQREAGEDSLSDICSTFPRHSRNFANQFEHALLLSCPEAARKALLAGDAFDFVEADITLRSDSVIKVRPKWGMSLDMMNDVRTFCLQLMRTEGLAFWQQLAVLGLFCEELGLLLTQGRHAGLSQMLEKFILQIESGQVLDGLAEVQPNHAAQAQVFFKFWEGQKERTNSSAQQTIQQAVAEGLAVDPASGLVASEALIDSYRQGLRRLPEALVATPHLLAHFTLNEMFRELFPFDDASVYDHYLSLVSRLGLLRLMLAAQCNTAGALPGSVPLVQTVQVSSRLYQHPSFTRRAVVALKYLGLDKQARVNELLRT